MKTQPPITHAFAFASLDEKMRPYLMAEFAANGSPNLVLTTALIREIMRAPGFAKVLHTDLQSSVKIDYFLDLSHKLNASMDGTFQRASSSVYFPANLREGTPFFSGYARR